MGQDTIFSGFFLHNNYVEDPRVLKVNPLSPLRMSTILEKTLRDAMKNINVK